MDANSSLILEKFKIQWNPVITTLDYATTRL
jgi:hypothetical protein